MTRIAQRDRAQRAKMVARYKNTRNKAAIAIPNNNNISNNGNAITASSSSTSELDDDAIMTYSSSTLAAAESTESNMENNRNSYNHINIPPPSTPSQRSLIEKYAPSTPKSSVGAAVAPPTTGGTLKDVTVGIGIPTTTPKSTKNRALALHRASASPRAQSSPRAISHVVAAPPPPSPSRTSLALLGGGNSNSNNKNRLSDAKKKLAASRLASVQNETAQDKQAKRGLQRCVNAAIVSKKSAAIAVGNNDGAAAAKKASSIGIGRGRSARSDQLARARTRAASRSRSRSPVPLPSRLQRELPSSPKPAAAGGGIKSKRESFQRRLNATATSSSSTCASNKPPTVSSSTTAAAVVQQRKQTVPPSPRRSLESPRHGVGSLLSDDTASKEAEANVLSSQKTTTSLRKQMRPQTPSTPASTKSTRKSFDGFNENDDDSDDDDGVESSQKKKEETNRTQTKKVQQQHHKPRPNHHRLPPTPSSSVLVSSTQQEAPSYKTQRTLYMKMRAMEQMEDDGSVMSSSVFTAATGSSAVGEKNATHNFLDDVNTVASSVVSDPPLQMEEMGHTVSSSSSSSASSSAAEEVRSVKSEESELFSQLEEEEDYYCEEDNESVVAQEEKGGHRHHQASHEEHDDDDEESESDIESDTETVVAEEKMASPSEYDAGDYRGGDFVEDDDVDGFSESVVDDKSSLPVGNDAKDTEDTAVQDGDDDGFDNRASSSSPSPAKGSDDPFSGDDAFQDFSNNDPFTASNDDESDGFPSPSKGNNNCVKQFGSDNVNDDGFQDEWPSDNFPSTSWGSSSQKEDCGFDGGIDKWDDDPFAADAVVGAAPETSTAKEATQGDGVWDTRPTNVTSVTWESDNEESPPPPPPPPPGAELEAKEKENERVGDDKDLEWNMDEGGFSALGCLNDAPSSSCSGDDEDQENTMTPDEAGIDVKANEMNSSKNNVVQQQQQYSVVVPESSSSTSFEWDDVVKAETSESVETEYDDDAKADEMTEAGGSTRYEGFGSVLEPGRLTNIASRDDDGEDDYSSSDDEERDEMNNLLDEMNSKASDCCSNASEGTTGSATEFDPLSMFGECDDVVPDINEHDKDEDDDKLSAMRSSNKGSIISDANSAFSWASPNISVFKPAESDSSKNISFPSLNSGTNNNSLGGGPPPPPPGAPASSSNTTPVKALDSPAGTESLESWWASRYASTQHSDINSAVQEALTKRNNATPPPPTTEHHLPPQQEAATAHTMTLKSEQQQQKKRNAKQQQTKPSRTPLVVDEEDSIFSGLDDDMSLPSIRSHRSSQRQHKSSSRHNNNKTSRAAVTTNPEIAPITTNDSGEDIFSGVNSIDASRQDSRLSRTQMSSSQFPRLKESNAMKSLLDGASAGGETPSVMSRQGGGTQVAQQQGQQNNNTNVVSTPGGFTQDHGYGVINLQKSKHSPTANSVTSDITSSVIFGGGNDFTSPTGCTRRQSSQRGGNSGRPLNILETYDEVNDQDQEILEPHHETVVTTKKIGPISPLPDVDRYESRQQEVAGKHSSHQDSSPSLPPPPPAALPNVPIEDNQLITKESFSKNASRGVSLLSDSATANDSATNIRTKLGIESVEEEGITVTEDMPQDMAPSIDSSGSHQQHQSHSVADTVNRVKESFLSQFSCGMFAASSFAFCEANGLSIDSPRMTGADQSDLSFHQSQQRQNSEQTESTEDQSVGTKGSESETNVSGTTETGGSETVEDTLEETIETSKGSKTMETCASLRESPDSDSDNDSEDDDTDDPDDNASASESGSEDESLSGSDSDDDEVSERRESLLSHCEDETATYDQSTIYTTGESFATPQRRKRWKRWSRSARVPSSIGSPSPLIKQKRLSKEEVLEARSEAYEKLLMYAYTALSTESPTSGKDLGEKGEGKRTVNGRNMLFPPVLSHQDAVLRSEAMFQVLAKLSSTGIEVLKLNHQKKWQPRILTVTREVTNFQKSEDLRFNGFDSCPQGLLWVKKFDRTTMNHTVASIYNSGKGGLLFSSIECVSVMKDNHPLSRKQKKGKFKESITFVLHVKNAEGGPKREILFRCVNKDDVFALSSGFQAIIDRMRNDELTGKIRGIKGELKRMSIDTLPDGNTETPLGGTKPFSPSKAIASPVADDRWEV